MSIKTPENPPSPTANRSSKKSYLLALALTSSSLLTGLLPTGLVATGMTATSMTAQAASLGDLFSNKSSSQPKFLPVDQAFQVGSISKPVATGTQLSINFDITPEHYVYKNQIKLTILLIN